MIAWHFSRDDGILGYGDKRKIKVGEIHTVDPPVKLCKWGLHASQRVIDALDYAPGALLWRVELSGEIKSGMDKMVATERRYLACIDASVMLDRFAKACALSVVHLWNAPEIIMRFLLGDAAARDAARDAAWAATRAAARDAAWAAARDAAWAATRGAAWAAARDAAWAAAREEQNEVLTEYALEAMEWK